MAAHSASGALRIPLLAWLFSPPPSTAFLLIKQKHQYADTLAYTACALSLSPCAFIIRGKETATYYM